MIVDDEPSIANLAARILARLNYKPLALTNAAAAAIAFETTPEAFDLLITDLTMPHLTGLDLARRVLAVRPGLPIILCTGHRSVEQESEFSALGIRMVLNKPFRTEALAQAIHDALRQKV
jgi:DNA-binding NtrC family response regulator